MPRVLLLLVAVILAPRVAGAGGICGGEQVLHSGVVYLQATHEVPRFDLAAGLWLSPIPLAFDQHAFPLAADANSVYVWTRDGIGHAQVRLDASGATLARYELPGEVARAVVVDDDLVFLATSSQLRAYDRDSGALLGEVPLSGSADSLSQLTGDRLLLSASGEGWIVAYDGDGTLSEPAPLDPDGNYGFVAFPSVSPDGEWIVGQSGDVWSGSGSGFVDSLNELPYGLGFLEDRWVVSVRGGLRLLDASRARIGWLPWPFLRDPPELFVDGGVVWATECEAGAVTFAPVDLGAFGPEPLEPPDDPVSGWGWLPHEAVSVDDVLYVAPELQAEGPGIHLREQLYRWSLSERRFLPSIALSGYPRWLGALPGGGLLFNEAGSVQRLLSGDPPPMVRLFGSPAGSQCGPVVVEGGLYVCRRLRRLLLDESGSLISATSASSQADGVLWDPTRRRVIEFRQITVGPDVRGLASIDVLPDGSLAEQTFVEVPEADVPLRLSSDGAWLLAGRHLFDPHTFEVVAALARDVVDATWSGATLVTIEYTDQGDAVYRESDPGVGELLELPVPGTPVAIVPAGEQAVYFYREGGETRGLQFAPGQADLDGDSFANASDAFPLDFTEWVDRDGDGVGDNADAFPDDPFRSADSDGDGIEDGSDRLPHYAARQIAWIEGTHTLKTSPGKRLALPIQGWQLHLLREPLAALCTALETCLLGTLERSGRSGRRLVFGPTEASIDALGRRVAAAWANRSGAPATVEIRKLEIRIKPTADGREFRVRIRAKHRGEATDGRTTRGRYTAKAEGAWLEGATLR